jgi:hypothetical protein
MLKHKIMGVITIPLVLFALTCFGPQSNSYAVVKHITIDHTKVVPKHENKVKSVMSITNWNQDISACFVEEARKNNVELPMALAIVKVESGYHPKSRSRSGCKGLFQLSSETARGVAKIVHIPSNRMNLYEPKTNIKIGMAHYGMLIRQYKSHPKALNVYNRGHLTSRGGYTRYSLSVINTRKKINKQLEHQIIPKIKQKRENKLDGSSRRNNWEIWVTDHREYRNNKDIDTNFNRFGNNSFEEFYFRPWVERQSGSIIAIKNR